MEDIQKFTQEINRFMAEREKLDLKAVYARLKYQYAIALTNTFSLENGEEDFRENFEILCGESLAGKFYLYHDGLCFIFDVDKSDGTSTHWHPKNIEEASNDVILFMQGNCKY